MIELNRKPKLGLVSVASHDESGGQRAESFLQAAKEALAKAGICLLYTSPSPRD